MDKIKKNFLEIIIFFFLYFMENYSRRVRKSTNKKILALELVGTLPTPFSFILALQMLIGYSMFLGILVFQLGIFVIVNFTYQLIHFMSYCCSEHNMLLKINFL